MIRSLTRKVLGSAAAAVDRVATAAVAAHAQRTAQTRPRPHADRLRALERLEARFRGASLDGFFAEPRAISVGERAVRRARRDRTVTDLSWQSGFIPLDEEVAERYGSARENELAVARRFQRGTGRPAVILIHGYMAGPFAFEERIWPLAALDRAYPGQLRFSFRHNPLPMHPLAVPAAGEVANVTVRAAVMWTPHAAKGQRSSGFTLS